MRLFEYQAKEVFAENGIAIPAGMVIDNSEQVVERTSGISDKCVLKSQVLSGGRGKVGLVQFAASLDEAKQKSEQLFGCGKHVKKLLVEEHLDIAKEIYLAVTIDPVASNALIMACAHGGVDIENIAAESETNIIKEHVDMHIGLMPFQIRSVCFRLGLSGGVFKQVAKVIPALFAIFQKHDCELVEINPLAVTSGGEVIAADGKIILDDNAVYRQSGFELSREHYETDLEYEAAQKGFPFLSFDGDIGLMCAGAGLTNTVYDLISDFGGTVSNYLEFGGPNYKRAVEAMELTLKANPKVILIVTFGTIARADVMANGIVEAIEKLSPQIPIVTAIRGTGEEDAQDILKSAGLEPLPETEQAVLRAIELAQGGLK